MKPCATPGRSASSSPATRPPKPRWFDCCVPPAAGARPRNSFSAHSEGSRRSTWSAPALCGRRRTCPFKPTRGRTRTIKSPPSPMRSGCVCGHAPPCTRCSLRDFGWCPDRVCLRRRRPPVVWAAHWMSHLAFSWESPIWRHWTEEFARDHCFVHYDERGNGLSDWDNPTFSIDAFVRDLEAVVDTLGLDRFALIGSSKGGATAIAYAARHPERVSHLVLYSAVAQGWRGRGNSTEIERHEEIITLTRQGWAQDNPAIRQILTSLLLPDATLEEMGWFNDLQRISASAENAARLQQSTGDVNVLDLLPGIAAPTLVLHCRDDACMPFEQGRLIASRIPRARLVPLESRNHILLPRDPAWVAFVSEVRRFLREGAPTMSRAHRH